MCLPLATIFSSFQLVDSPGFQLTSKSLEQDLQQYLMPSTLNKQGCFQFHSSKLASHPAEWKQNHVTPPTSFLDHIFFFRKTYETASFWWHEREKAHHEIALYDGFKTRHH